jgi:hypothetical protein
MSSLLKSACQQTVVNTPLLLVAGQLNDKHSFQQYIWRGVFYAIRAEPIERSACVIRHSVVKLRSRQSCIGRVLIDGVLFLWHSRNSDN